MSVLHECLYAVLEHEGLLESIRNAIKMCHTLPAVWTASAEFTFCMYRRLIEDGPVLVHYSFSALNLSRTKYTWHLFWNWYCSRLC